MCFAGDTTVHPSVMVVSSHQNLLLISVQFEQVSQQVSDFLCLFLSQILQSSIVSYKIFLPVIQFTIFFSRPFFQPVKIILNSNPVSLLNSNNYIHSSIIQILMTIFNYIQFRTDLCSLSSTGQSGAIKIGWCSSEAGGWWASYLSKHCSSRRKGKTY